MLKHIIFDVNETLLDMAALDPLFEQVFGHSHLRTEWFLTLQTCWMTNTITGQYQPFGELAQAALRMVGAGHKVDVSDLQCQALAEALETLPAHQDVRPALQRLKTEGFVLIALSNGALEALRQQLESAQLSGYFDHIMAGSEIEQFKPAVHTYQMVAQRLGLAIDQLLMVAAHAWDLAGAAHAGCRTAFLERPGKVLNPIGVKPDLTGAGLGAIVDQLA